MASVDTLNNPNDPTNPNGAANQANQAPQGQTNQPATTGGAGAVTATGAGNVTGQVTGTNNPAQPFQNISSYLAANEPQSQQLATQVAGTVSQPINQAQNAIQSSADTFTKNVSAGYTPANNDLISAVASNPSYVVGENPDNVNNFLAQLNNAYKGPTDFTQSPEYSNIETAIANAQGQAQATQTPQGIQTLLNSVEGPTTAGINKLDSLLLTNRPENISAIQAAGAGASALPGTLTSTTQNLNSTAAQGAKTASDTKAAAAKALQDALAAEQGNLTGQQDTIQGIVNEYNKSTGIINPVTQTIAQDIQNYLQSNPNLKLSNATDVLAPLMNLQNISMPDISTYASPYDYQTVAALAKLGLDPSALSGLPIDPSKADLAQTFKVPDALQNAVGQAPGVEAALNQELTGLSGQITNAYQPYQDLMSKEMTRADLRTQLDNLQNPLQQATKALEMAQQRAPGNTPAEQKAYQDNLAAAKSKVDDLTGQKQALLDKATQAGVMDNLYGSYWDSIGQMANGLQWLPQASTGYNDLITAINAELGKLGQVGVPTLNYAPTTLTDPVSGAPIGISKAAGDVGAIATGVGGTVGAGIGAAQSGTALAATELAAQTGMSLPEAQAAITASSTTGGTAGLGTLSALQTAGPAAIAAYGTSNVIQNSMKHPIESGLSTLANMGLSLATLSLPPKIFESIGKDITNVIHSIGDFFGGLF